MVANRSCTLLLNFIHLTKYLGGHFILAHQDIPYSLAQVLSHWMVYTLSYLDSPLLEDMLAIFKLLLLQTMLP